MSYAVIDFQPILKEFLSRVPLVASQLVAASPKGETTAWTRAVKKVLEEIGAGLGYESIYSDRAAGLHEFMLDFVWWNKGPGGGGVLACESEFGNTRDEARNPVRVGEDFDKLLSFKAPLKLMIFDSYGDHAGISTTVSDVLAEVHRYLREYGQHIAGETYLLVDLAPSRRVWRCYIHRDGQDPQLSFEELILE